MAEFDRQNPLFERNDGSVEVISADNSKSNEHFTIRILSGHRTLRNGRGRERVFRFEVSDECNVVKTISSFDQSTHVCKTPINNRQTAGLNLQRTPYAPVIRAPFMTSDRGRKQIPNAGDQFGERGVDVALSQMQLSQKTAMITSRAVELYELEVGESDFEELRRDQALLVDFDDFANSLISLMQLCWSVNDGDQYSSGNAWNDSNRAEVQWGNATWDPRQNQQQWQHQQQHGLESASPFSQHYTMRSSSPFNRPPVSTYTCRLETSAQASNANGNTQWRKGNNDRHARFTIVESNQFRELTHLTLALDVGTDKSVRQYLSSRLSEAMVQVVNVNNRLEIQRQRCEVAERNAIDANKRLADTTQAYEAEKYQLHCQAEERFQTESSCRYAEINSIKTTKDAEIQALKDELQRNKMQSEDKVRLLEESNRKVNEEKSSYQSEKERLSSQLGQQETANRLLANELSSLKSRLERITEEKSATEKNLRELQVLLASVETATSNQQHTINQSEAHIASTERVYADAKLTISRQHSQIDELQRRLVESESEAARYKELSGRYQMNRAEMKNRIKEKAEIIRQQEETIRDEEKNVTELKHRVESLSGDLKRIQAEKDAALNELADSRKMMNEASKKLDNNQQVIAWLNKQLQTGKTPSSGVVWQGATPKAPPPRHESPAAARPDVNQGSLSARSSSLSRYLPSARPFTQHHGVTPDIKPASVPQGLHPSPHPL